MADYFGLHRPVSDARKKIAVVGTGISGLSAAWLLNGAHDVTVYEKEDRIGGHSHTVPMELEGRTVPVDTGFIVYNEVNYPNLTALFQHLEVPTLDSCMSFSASIDNGRLEYGTTTWRSLFAQPYNVVRPRLWSMIGEILKLHRKSGDYLARQDLDAVSLGHFLDSEGYSKGFQNDHLLPMCAAIWSCPVRQARNYPATSFLRFFQNHGLLQLFRRPQWKTVAGGSIEYVRRLSASLGDRVRLGTPVVRIERLPDGVRIVDARGGDEIYDDVVLGVHGADVLKLLADPSAVETEIFSAFRYQTNVAYLHTDRLLLPRAKSAWASWNYISGADAGSAPGAENSQLCVSYWMNRLQKLPTTIPVVVTLNPAKAPSPDKTHARFEYEHPLFDTRALDAQKRLWPLQGQNRTWFCGAYFGSGFHEDGLQAGLAVAEQLGGVRRPWQVEDPYGRLVSFVPADRLSPSSPILSAVA